VNVAVVGSCRTQVDSGPRIDRPLFEDACKAIGQKLAERHDKLILAHPESQDSAEYYSLAGFRNSEDSPCSPGPCCRQA
jgi:hypothetical protein